MNNDLINGAIRRYCQERKLNEASAALGNIEDKILVDLHQIFQKFFDKKCEKSHKLSFSFKVDNKSSMLKKRLADMNNAERKFSEIKKPKKHKLKKSGSENIPESFLLLMDELCLDRKNALKFYKNPDQWAYVKSDRKIYCTKKGDLMNIFDHNCKLRSACHLHLLTSKLTISNS